MNLAEVHKALTEHGYTVLDVYSADYQLYDITYSYHDIGAVDDNCVHRINVSVEENAFQYIRILLDCHKTHKPVIEHPLTKSIPVKMVSFQFNGEVPLKIYETLKIKDNTNDFEDESENPYISVNSKKGLMYMLDTFYTPTSEMGMRIINLINEIRQNVCNSLGHVFKPFDYIENRRTDYEVYEQREHYAMPVCIMESFAYDEYLPYFVFMYDIFTKKCMCYVHGSECSKMLGYITDPDLSEKIKKAICKGMKSQKIAVPVFEDDPNEFAQYLSRWEANINNGWRITKNLLVRTQWHIIPKTEKYMALVQRLFRNISESYPDVRWENYPEAMAWKDEVLKIYKQ